MMAATAQNMEQLKALIAIFTPPAKAKRTKKVAGTCVKCGSHEHLHRHHITYYPPNIVVLCRLCHSRITGLNTKGSLVAGGNKVTRTEYTNRLRIVLWKWFITNPWPNKRRVSRTEVRSILRGAKFVVELRSTKRSRQHYKRTNDLANQHRTPQFKNHGMLGA